MGLVVRKVQGGAQDRIRSLVADHAQSLEAGLTVLDTSLRLGRTTIDVIALDAKQNLVLVVAGEVADAKMLVGTLDAYVWCLAHPESIQRRYPAASIAITRPPRVIFVAERIPDTFIELLEQLSAVPVECQELHTPASPQTPALPARPKVEAPVAPMVPVAPVIEVAPVIAAPAPVTPAPTAPSQRLAPAQIAAWLDAGLAQQRGRSVANGSSAASLTNGHSNGHVNGSANGHASAPTPAQPLSSPTLAQAMRSAEATIEHAAGNLGAPQVTKSPAPQTTVASVAPVASPANGTAPAPAVKAATPAAKSATPAEPDAANHPALESLKFPKGGVSRQWQDFLDQLAAANK
jgi:hypothetical protein